MFEDITLNKILAKDVDQPFAKGGFGAVYRIKHPFVSCMHKYYVQLYVYL